VFTADVDSVGRTGFVIGQSAFRRTCVPSRKNRTTKTRWTLCQLTALKNPTITGRPSHRQVPVMTS